MAFAERLPEKRKMMLVPAGRRPVSDANRTGGHRNGNTSECTRLYDVALSGERAKDGS